MTLKDNIVFSNGDPMTMEDVLYSMNRVAQSPRGGTNFAVIDLDACTISDDGLTLYVQYNTSYGPWQSALNIYMMPGDPVLMQMPDNYTQEYYDEVKHDMGLDRPYIVQLGSYIWGVVTRLDLGTSYMTNRAVTEQISERVWVSVRIGLISVFMTALLGIPFGIIAPAPRAQISQRRLCPEFLLSYTQARTPPLGGRRSGTLQGKALRV